MLAEQEERDELVRKYYPKLEGITEGKALTEEQFDEAAGKKDACYYKVKADTKCGHAYASGALVGLKLVLKTGATVRRSNMFIKDIINEDLYLV